MEARVSAFHKDSMSGSCKLINKTCKGGRFGHRKCYYMIYLIKNKNHHQIFKLWKKVNKGGDRASE